MDSETNRLLRYKNSSRDQLLKVRRRTAQQVSRNQCRTELLLKRRGVPSDISSVSSTPRTPAIESTPQSIKKYGVRIDPASPLHVRKARLNEWKELKKLQKCSENKRPPFVFKKITYQLPPFLTSTAENTIKRTALPQTLVYRHCQEGFKASGTEPAVPENSSNCSSFIEPAVPVKSVSPKQLTVPKVIITRASFAPMDFKFSGLNSLPKYDISLRNSTTASGSSEQVSMSS